MKRTFVLLTVVMSIFALTGLAFAAETATINVTSEPISAGATCDKAGGFNITFDRNTILLDGDQITYDLDLGAVLCETIDFVIAADAGATLMPDGTDVGYDNTNTLDADSPVVLTDDSGNSASANGGVYFHIHGEARSARVTIDVIGESADGSLTIGDGNNDKLSVRFLGQGVNDDFTDLPGFWVDIDSDNDSDTTIYDEPATKADNTQCIDVSNFNESTVNANFDSKDDKFTFIPSNPQIAHVTPAQGFSFAPCAKDSVGLIEIGIIGGQGGSDTCFSFDNDQCDNPFDCAGYCHVVAHNNRMVIAADTGSFPLDTYQITMEILVNGNTGEHGVYWSDQDVAVGGFQNLSDACSENAETSLNTMWEQDDGDSATPEGPSAGDCDVTDPVARAVRLITEEGDLGLASGDDYLFVDIPALNYDIDDIQPGDQVSIRISIVKTPCSTLFTGDFDIGTFGCPQTSVANVLIFPYIPPPNTSYWTNTGFAITNLSAFSGTADITWIEMDGDRGTLSLPVNAANINLQSNSGICAQFTQVDGDGTLCDAAGFAFMQTNFNADGFLFIGNPVTGEAFSYLPRRDTELPVIPLAGP